MDDLISQELVANARIVMRHAAALQQNDEFSLASIAVPSCTSALRQTEEVSPQ
jgi:hypothetical protein